MADGQEVIEVQVSPEQQVADTKAQLDQAMSLNLGIPFGKQSEAQIVAEAAPETTQVVETVAAEAPSFTFDTLKEKYGYEKPEDAYAEIESLRAFKNTPQQQAELKFENEQSKKLYEAMLGGKMKEAYAYMAEQEKLESVSGLEVTDDTSEEIIKAGMSVRYKDLSPKEIDFKFNKQFGLPKEPVLREDEDAEDFKQRHDEWKEKVADIKIERSIEAKTFKPEINSAKAKLVLPDIPQTVDQDYLSWKQEQEEMKTTNAEVFEAYNKFKPSDIETKQAYIDEANKVNFEFKYVPGEASFKDTQSMVTDLDKFFAKFKNSDGSPNRTGFFAAIDFAVNKDKIITEAIKQGITAYIKGQLPDNQNSNIQRQEIVNFEPSELDKQMQARGLGRVN